MDISDELKEILKEAGAALVGYGDMEGIEAYGYPVGVSVAVPIPSDILRGMEEGPTKEYYDMYFELNNKLNNIVSAGEAFLKKRGYKAYAQTTDVVKQDNDDRSVLPHKTVATRAGLGWIGKSCLLVTPEYGSAIRISSLLTDAPLKFSKPIGKSRCGSCNRCVEACPAKALKGTLWESGMAREDIFERGVCRKKQRELLKARTGIEDGLCGICFVVCPYTRKYISNL